MSWSFTAVGTTDKLVEALEAHSEKISKNPDDNCRREFDEAKPHLIALLKQNVADPSIYTVPPLLQIEASGSQTRQRKPDEKEFKLTQSNCTVSIKSLWGFVG